MLTFVSSLDANTKGFIKALRTDIEKKISVRCSFEKVEKEWLERKVDTLGSVRNKLDILLSKVKEKYPIYVISKSSIPKNPGVSLTKEYVLSLFVSKARIPFPTLKDSSARLVIFLKHDDDTAYNTLIDEVVADLKSKGCESVECVSQSEIEGLVARRLRYIREFEDSKTSGAVPVKPLAMEKATFADGGSNGGGGGSGGSSSGVGAGSAVAAPLPLPRLRLQVASDGAHVVPEIVSSHAHDITSWLSAHDIPATVAWYNGVMPIFELHTTEGSKRRAKVFYISYEHFLLDETFKNLNIPEGKETHPEYHLVLCYDIPKGLSDEDFKRSTLDIANRYHVGTISLTAKNKEEDKKHIFDCFSKHCLMVRITSPAKVSPVSDGAGFATPSSVCKQPIRFGFGELAQGEGAPSLVGGVVTGGASAAPGVEPRVGKTERAEGGDEGEVAVRPCKLVRNDASLNVMAGLAVQTVLDRRCSGGSGLLSSGAGGGSSAGIFVDASLDAVKRTCEALDLESFQIDRSMNLSALPGLRKVVFLPFSKWFLSEDQSLLSIDEVAGRFFQPGTTDLLPQFCSDQCLLIILNDSRERFNIPQILLLNRFTTKLRGADIFWRQESFSDEGINDSFIKAICKFAGIPE